MGKTIKDEQPRTYFDCAKCPAYCCSIYDRVQVTKRDIKRLAKHFGVEFEAARRRYTKQWKDERVLKRVGDVIFPETCMFLDQETRGCTIYHARPAVCREYPDRARCAYYDVLQFERKQQADETVIPLVQITFHEVKKKIAASDNNGKAERVWEWEPEKK
jgi:Fe-S-cluster containining protein